MQATAYLPLFKEAYNEWSEDKASRLAAALAYYTAISLAPLLVLAVTVLSWMSLDGRNVVEGQMGMLMGQTGKEAAATMIDAAKQSSGVWATIISLAVLLFGASGVFAELQDSLNTIWEVQPDPKAGIWDTIKKRFFSLAMVFGVIFLLLVSLVISMALGGLVTRFAGEGKVVGLVLDVVLSLIVYTGVFALLFAYLPDVRIPFRDVWPGAVLTAVLFAIGKYLLTLYLTKGSTASAYGAAGSLAALLIWVYYAAQILFYGAEFTRVYAVKFGGYHPPERGAVPVTEEQRLQRGLVSKVDLEQAKEAEESLAAQRGAPYLHPASVPDRRVVTITRPTVESNRAYALAGLGLAAGFVVGALGMLRGRKYQRAGIDQISLDDRLSDLERRLGDTPLTVAATASRIQSHLNAIDTRLNAAAAVTKKRTADTLAAGRESAREATNGATLKDRFAAAVERQERKHHPTFVDRLKFKRRQPTWFERLSEKL